MKYEYPGKSTCRNIQFKYMGHLFCVRIAQFAGIDVNLCLIIITAYLRHIYLFFVIN